MMKKISCPVIFFLLFLCPKYHLAFKGTVRNIYAQPISNALVEFVNESGEKFTTYTDAQGVFEINLKLFDTEADKKGLYVFGNYPNPFYSETIIPFYLNRQKKVTLYIADRTGRILFTAFQDKIYPKGIHNYRLKTLQDNGSYLPPGMYLAILTDGKVSHSIKLLVVSLGTASPQIRDFQDISLETLQPAVYQLKISAPGYKDYVNKRFIPADRDERYFVLHRHDSLPWKCVDHYLARHMGNGNYEPIFVNGICFGISTPGTNPGNLSASKQELYRWLELIWEAGFNSVRTYTLHYPHFYEALDEFNSKHVERPLWLCQGVWLDEEMPSKNLYDFSNEFDSAVVEVIDCINGQRTIPERKGKAYGTYSLDVSKWVMAYIIGREVYPDEIFYTDSVENQNQYKGEHFEIENASPSEVWWTIRLDKMVSYQRQKYGLDLPISQSSWPTLDPLTHPTEPPYPISSEDWVQVDLSKLVESDAPGGYFASYHAYPYYPDFINDSPEFQQFSDQYGPNSYLGYLTTLKNYYGKKPLLLGEYGVPSSWGNAHFSHSGMHHGGHDERQQGIYNIRLIKNIHQAHCGGGWAFAWMDEWFKTMWYTNPIGSTYDRRPLWWNIVSAEENFGLIAFQVREPDFGIWPSSESTCGIKKMSCSYDPTFFYTHIHLNKKFSDQDTLWIAFDTYRSDLGESVLLSGDTIQNRAEFLLMITRNNSLLFVTEAYDTYGIYHGFSSDNQLYRSISSDGAPWKVLRYSNGWKEDIDIDSVGKLVTNIVGISDSTSKDAIYIDSNKVKCRIPWTYLLVVDPSNQEVLHDDRSTKKRETMITDGFYLTAIFNNCRVESKKRMLWPRWDEAWPYSERIKEGYWIVQHANFTLDLKPY